MVSPGPLNEAFTCTSIIPVYIPCTTLESYSSRWSYFSNFIETDTYTDGFSAVSNDENKGTVNIINYPNCDNTDAVVEAIPNSGYHFSHWKYSSGGHSPSGNYDSNPITIHPSSMFPSYSSETYVLIAYFASGNGGGNNAIDNPEKSDTPVRVHSENGRIHVSVAGQTPDNFAVYDVMGRRVFQTTNADETQTLPAGLYMVKVGDLKPQKVLVR